MTSHNDDELAGSEFADVRLGKKVPDLADGSQRGIGGEPSDGLQDWAGTARLRGSSQ